MELRGRPGRRRRRDAALRTGPQGAHAASAALGPGAGQHPSRAESAARAEPLPAPCARRALCEPFPFAAPSIQS